MPTGRGGKRQGAPRGLGLSAGSGQIEQGLQHNGLLIMRVALGQLQAQPLVAPKNPT